MMKHDYTEHVTYTGGGCAVCGKAESTHAWWSLINALAYLRLQATPDPNEQRARWDAIYILDTAKGAV